MYLVCEVPTDCPHRALPTVTFVALRPNRLSGKMLYHKNSSVNRTVLRRRGSFASLQTPTASRRSVNTVDKSKSVDVPNGSESRLQTALLTEHFRRLPKARCAKLRSAGCARAVFAERSKCRGWHLWSVDGGNCRRRSERTIGWRLCVAGGNYL